MTKRSIYWLCQFLGWGFYGFVQVFLYALVEQFDIEQVEAVSYQVAYYVLTTHLFRTVIIQKGWFNHTLTKLIPRLLLSTFLLSGLNYGYLLALEYFSNGISASEFGLVNLLINMTGPWSLYFLWSIFYFAFHYVEQYNKSLRAETAAREVELNNLKSQLNPHFIFNALNSIRALIDENPRKSKEAVTQLSHILRNSLVSDRKKLITFNEELKTVMDYLALESIRYEERLRTRFQIDERSGHFLIPPLMVQTLVENGIKHGIGTLTKGGEISITTHVKERRMIIELRNSGQLSKNMNISSGFGLENTRKRLALIYGEQATFEIKNEDKQTVLTRLSMPSYD